MKAIRAAVTAGLLLAVVAAPAGAAAWEVPGILHTVHLASREFGVSADLMECVRSKEGGDNPHAVGDGGAARGLWQFHARTFYRGATLAGYPEWVATDPSWRDDVTVSTRAAAALMASRARGDGPTHWTPVFDGRCKVALR